MMKVILTDEFKVNYKLACTYTPSFEALYEEALKRIEAYPEWGSPNVPERIKLAYGSNVRKWRISKLERSIYYRFDKATNTLELVTTKHDKENI